MAQEESTSIDESINTVTSVVSDTADKLDHYIQLIAENSVHFATSLILALVVWIVGKWFVNRIVNLSEKALAARKVEQTLKNFLVNIFSIILKAILIIIVASMIGIETASLIAMLGAAGLAIGLALQGSLANFAGGILILLFKPFKTGDLIEAQGFVATVVEIQIFNSVLVTLDNQRVIIPNALLSNGCVKNIFAEETRRVDLTFGVSYGDDLIRVKEILRNIVDNDERILKDPIADIFVAEHGASSVNLVVRPWVKSENYWPVYFGLTEKVKIAFDQEGISIPFPQRDVHIIQEK